MLSPVQILRKTIVNALINRKTTINCEVIRLTSVPCSLDMEHIIVPSFVSAEIGLIDAFTWVITFDRDLANVVPLVAENSFISAGFTFNSIAKTGNKEITLVSDQNAVYGQNLTIQYNQALTLNPLQGTNGLKVSSFTKPVTNNVPLAPYVLSAEVGLINAYTIVLTFSEAMDQTSTSDVIDLVPDFSGGEVVIDSLTWNSATELYLGILGDVWRIIQFGETGTISYIPGTNKLKNIAGILVSAFTKDVTNNCIAPPTLTSATVENANPDILVLTFSDELINAGTPGSAFAINFSGGAISIVSVSENLNIRYLNLSRDITFGETGTVQYLGAVDPTNNLMGLSYNYVIPFTEDVTNNVQPVASDPVLQSITVLDSNPYEIIHTYDLALDETSTPNISAYVISNKTNVSVVVSGFTSIVTVAERVYWGDTLTSAYTKPGTNMIKSTLGGEADSFTAQSVTNQVAQLAFQNANTLCWFMEDLTTITKDGSNLVSVWADKQGSGRDLLQAIGTNQPLWTSTGITFDGIDNLMKCDPFTLNQPEMIYIVFKQISWTNLDEIFDGNASLSGTLKQRTATPGLHLYAGANGAVNNNAAIGDYVIARCLFNGAASTLQINETAVTTTNPGAANMGGFSLSLRAPYYGNFEVKEIIVRNTADDSTVQAAIYSYLSSKYSI